MKRIMSTIVLAMSVSFGWAQQFGLYNSMTLYDAFENPSQRSFQADSSRKYAFNFFIPTVSFNGRFSGPAENNFKTLLYDRAISGRNLAVGQSQMNTLTAHTNNYILMLRIFSRVEYNREIGLSWQIRNEGRGNISNETFAIFDSFTLFEPQAEYSNIFNNNGYNQSYNQYSFTYREDFNKRLSLGVKLSLLSGITYNKLNIQESLLSIRPDLNEFDVVLRGNFKSNVLDDDLNSGIINPTFRDPGVSVSLGGSYKFRGGWFLLGNIKDIGFIKWNKNSYNYDLDNSITIDNAQFPNADERLRDRIEDVIKETRANGQFNSMINGKAEALVNKNFGNFKPNFIVSKNLFYPGGNVALVNNYHWKNVVLTGTGSYNLDKYIQIGGQFMIRSPNVEFFMGTDNLLKTYHSSRSLITDFPYGGGASSASAYMGFSMKFGRMMEHQPNSNFIPGMNANHDRVGIFRRLFGKR